jgi:hypothetical protein
MGGVNTNPQLVLGSYAADAAKPAVSQLVREWLQQTA